MTGSVLVLCTANVCRSIYAAAILDAALAPAGITACSAGLSANPTRPCALVQRRAGKEGLALLQEDSRQVHGDDIADADLVLVMTAPQRATIARSAPSARTRIFTLVEAAIIGTALADEGVRCASLRDYVGQLDLRRSSVDLPVAHDTKRVLGIVPRRSKHARMAIGIEDGHVSPVRGEHERSLDLVRQYSDQLIAAWSTQPWFAGSSAEPAFPEPQA
jgi:protein-tyrosine-phosphatase